MRLSSRWGPSASTLVAALAVAVLLPRHSAVAARQLPADLRLTADRAEAFIEARERHLNYLPGEVIVKFKPGVSLEGEQHALMALRSRPDANDLQWNGDFAVLRDASQPDAAILAQQLASQPEVLYAEPNYIAPIPKGYIGGEVEPTPPGFRRLGVPSDPDYNARQWNFVDIGLPRAWDIQPGGSSSVIVAVIDTGLTLARQTMTFPLSNGATIQNQNLAFDVSPDLATSKMVSPFDFAFFIAGSPVVDMDSHGTHVTSTIAESTNNAFGLAGVAYNVQIMPVKVCVSYWEVAIVRASSNNPVLPPADAGGCAFSAIANGIRYAADHGAKVMNISLGGDSPSTAIRDALLYAVQQGAFVAIAAGNEFENGNPTTYPAGYSDIDGVMAVGATGRSRTRAFYSSTGSFVEIAAPGGNSRDGGTAGEVWQITMRQTSVLPSAITPRFDIYDEVPFQGTSMATPHVAGVAALLYSQLGAAAKPALIEQMLRTSALDLGSKGKDNEFGYGLIQPRTALFGVGIRK